MNICFGSRGYGKEYIQKLERKNDILTDRVDQYEKDIRNLYVRCAQSVEILHGLREDLPLDIILTEIEHVELILKGEI